MNVLHHKSTISTDTDYNVDNYYTNMQAIRIILGFERIMFNIKDDNNRVIKLLYHLKK